MRNPRDNRDAQSWHEPWSQGGDGGGESEDIYTAAVDADRHSGSDVIFGDGSGGGGGAPWSFPQSGSRVGAEHKVAGGAAGEGDDTINS